MGVSWWCILVLLCGCQMFQQHLLKGPSFPTVLQNHLRCMSRVMCV